MEEIYNKHYIITDLQGRILDGWSDGPCSDRAATDAICINARGDYQFRLFPGGEENPALYTADGVPLYRWNEGEVVHRTEEEIAADRAAIPEPTPEPGQLDRVEAQATYTAMMTDTLLEV